MFDWGKTIHIGILESREGKEPYPSMDNEPGKESRECRSELEL